jgi:hypothetical protein
MNFVKLVNSVPGLYALPRLFSRDSQAHHLLGRGQVGGRVLRPHGRLRRLGSRGDRAEGEAEGDSRDAILQESLLI